MGNELSSEAVYKQYTYARNVIQWNLDIFNTGGTTKSGVRLRDDVTEGYGIIPNFFISAKMDENFDYSKDGIEKTDKKKNKHKNVQFKNRLFDRDTLLLFHYDVNFLYVLSLYARENSFQQAEWKNKIREKFRKEIQEWLQKDYDFYAMRAKPGVDGEAYIKRNFKTVVGKIYTPFSDKKTYSLALDTNDPEANNEGIKAALSEFFYVEPCCLGQNPDEVLPAVTGNVAVKPTDHELALCVTKEGVHFDKAVEKMKQTGKLGIALNMNGATLQLVEGFTTAKYLIIHTCLCTDRFGCALVITGQHHYMDTHILHFSDCLRAILFDDISHGNDTTEFTVTCKEQRCFSFFREPLGFFFYFIRHRDLFADKLMTAAKQNSDVKERGKSVAR